MTPKSTSQPGTTRRTLLLATLAAALSAAIAGSAPAQEEAPAAASVAPDGDLWSRPKLTGNWDGLRDRLEEKGLTVDLAATYTFQGVPSGGADGPLFRSLSHETDTGHTVSGDLALESDLEKAGLWSGGFFNFRLEGRAGRSVLQRAGSVSAVNNDALFPNVVDRFDDEAMAVTELSMTQYLGGRVALYGGLLNLAEGDENEFAGSALSNSHFLNSAILYSLVEDATLPNATLGGGILFEPNKDISGSFTVSGTEETAGEDPFSHTDGTTFSTEWTVGHEILERSGAQTAGFAYGIDASRTAIAADPRLVLEIVLSGGEVPTTRDDTWAFYYNAHQYLQGDAEGGWGLFVRFGVSDGDPNPVEWNIAGGLGGIGLLPRRQADTWGLGVFHLGVSNQDLLRDLGIGDEFGGELFYNVAVTPWLHVTLDAQVIDPALPDVDTAWVLGVRSHVKL
jgi:porin